MSKEKYGQLKTILFKNFFRQMVRVKREVTYEPQSHQQTVVNAHKYTHKCSICPRENVYTEFHHVITPNQAPEHQNNPKNLIELCIECHNRTTASLSNRYLNNLPEESRCVRCGKENHSEENCKSFKDARGGYLGWIRRDNTHTSQCIITIPNNKRRYTPYSMSRSMPQTVLQPIFIPIPPHIIEQMMQNGMLQMPNGISFAPPEQTTRVEDVSENNESCYRCGKHGHFARQCYSTHDKDGYLL